MQSSRKIHSGIIPVIVLICTVLICVVNLSSLVYAQENQELHQKTLDELSTHTSPSQIARIKVGENPSAIGIVSGKVYIANLYDNTVSVINGANNTKIADIKVREGPTAIGVAPAFDGVPAKVYTQYIFHKS